MFHNCNLLSLFSQRLGNSPENDHYEQIDEARQWYYCLACDVGFGSRDRHQWHLEVCPATKSCSHTNGHQHGNQEDNHQLSPMIQQH